MPALSIPLQHIMADQVELLISVALDGYKDGFRIGGRLVSNLRFADDIVLVASSEVELQGIVTAVRGRK